MGLFGGFLGKAAGSLGSLFGGSGGQGAPMDLSAPRSGGGMFGNFRNGGWREALMLASSGPEGLREYQMIQAARAEAARKRREDELAERKAAREQEERRAWERWIAGQGMNPQDENLARAFPEMAAREAYRTAPQWQVSPGMTNTIRVDPVTGEVQRGGALPLRPRAPPTPYDTNEEDNEYDYF
jgi:hypothetical protein